MAFSLNRSAKAIWELCDGRHTPIQISQELGQRFGIDADALLSDILEALAQLQKLGLVAMEEAAALIVS